MSVQLETVRQGTRLARQPLGRRPRTRRVNLDTTAILRRCCVSLLASTVAESIGLTRCCNLNISRGRVSRGGACGSCRGLFQRPGFMFNGRWWFVDECGSSMGKIQLCGTGGPKKGILTQTHGMGELNGGAVLICWVF